MPKSQQDFAQSKQHKICRYLTANKITFPTFKTHLIQQSNLKSGLYCLKPSGRIYEVTIWPCPCVRAAHSIAWSFRSRKWQQTKKWRFGSFGPWRPWWKVRSSLPAWWAASPRPSRMCCLPKPELFMLWIRRKNRNRQEDRGKPSQIST